jgi:hypothetical protein
MDTTQGSVPDTGPQTSPHTSRDTWMRGLFMLFFMIAGSFAQSVLGLIAILQFIWLLASGKPNEFMQRFGTSLSKWAQEVVRFQSCTSDEKPFPFKAWPAAD